ncbi:cytochrome P450 3A21-like [Dermacentor andersoni]|uniref:cytochrome P450 3A21-like n=1 Tax=Dermacentor andersoni TaxID=34620 RepID=UPI003B3B24EF
MVLLNALSPEWVILAATTTVLLYLYVTRNRNYWKNQNVPSEPFSLIFGATLKLFTNPVHELDLARYKKYGNLFGAFEMGKPILFVADPKLVKQVLVDDFSSLPNRRTLSINEPLLDNMMSMAPVDVWRKVRLGSAPAFSTKVLRKMNDMIEDCALTTTEHLKKAASKEDDIDVKQLFWDYALDLIAKCAFGMKLDSHTDPTNEFVTQSKQVLSQRFTPRLFVMIVFPAMAKRFRIGPMKPDVIAFFRNLCQNTMKANRDAKMDHENFLQLLIDGKTGHLHADQEKAFERDHRLFDISSDIKADAPSSLEIKLTEDEAMAQCILFFLAGQQKASTAIACALYLLAIHPEVQDRLRKEVDECCMVHGDRPSLDAITKLKYLHCVVSETLRLHPPVSRLERSPCEDYIIGDTGVKVTKSDIVAVPVYAMQHDPQYFPEPFTFDPERFNDENVGSIQPYTYLPFGAGPRNCIGISFTLHAMKLSIFHTIRNVQVVRTEKTKVPLVFQNGFRPLTAEDVTLGIRKRVTFEMGKAVLFVGEAELVKQVLVNDFPSLPNRRTVKFNHPVLDNMMSMVPFERWRDIRMPVAHAFSAGNVKKMNSLIEDCALVTADHLKRAASNEEDIDIKKFFANYTLDVVARCVFAKRIDSQSDKKSDFVVHSRQAPSGSVTPRILMHLLFPFIARATGLLPLSPSVLAYFRSIGQNIIKNTEKEPQDENFLRLFLNPQEKPEEAQDTSFERDQRLFNLGSDMKPDTSLNSLQKLNEDQAMAQCLLFFIAGQETTARAIAYTLYLLAIHPDVQTQLRKEVNECFATHGDHPDLEAITKLKYLHCVISESLRMYPPVSRLERVPCCDYALGDKGVKLKQGDLITIPVYAMHHDPQYFPDPWAFKPERFDDENVASIKPYTYLPFGGGPRNCLALRFALQVVKLSVLHTIRNIQVIRTDKTRVPLEFKNGFGLLTAKEIILGIRKLP